MQFGTSTVVVTRPANTVIWVVVWSIGAAVVVWTSLTGDGGVPLAVIGGSIGVVMALVIPLGSATFVRDGRIRNGLRRRWIEPVGDDGIRVDQPLAGQFRPVAVDSTGASHPIGGPITAFAGKGRRSALAEEHVDAVRAALTPS